MMVYVLSWESILTKYPKDEVKPANISPSAKLQNSNETAASISCGIYGKWDFIFEVGIYGNFQFSNKKTIFSWFTHKIVSLNLSF